MTVGDVLRPIVFILLTALVVSAGEGVRLFPIPVPADRAVDSSSLAGSTKRTPYNYGTHSFSAHSKFGKTKILKKRSAADRDSSSAVGQFAPERIAEVRANARITFQTLAAPVSEFIGGLPPGRAPPV